MILRRAWAVLILSGLLLSSGLAGTTPQDTFFQLYFTLTEAERLEKREDYATAYQRYQDVGQKLEELKKKYPEWEPGIVNYRSKYVRDKLAGLKSKVADLPPPPAPKTEEVTPPPAKPVMAVNPTEVTDPSETATLRRRIVQLEQELTMTKTQLTSALTEISTLRTRLAAAEKELDYARTTNVEERMATLLQENNNLKTQLNDAQTRMKSLQNGADPAAVSSLQEQLTRVQTQLASLEKENQTFRAGTNTLKIQLELAQAKLAEADKQAATMPNTEEIRRENEVLRGIITRQLQEQARRDAAKRLATEELQNLKGKSEVLQQQIDILSSPLVVLSKEELALLKLPTSTGFQAPLVTSEPKASTVTTTPEPSPTKAPENQESAAPSGNSEITERARVPDDMREVANDAADLFKKKRYDESAERYNTIIQKYPDSLYAWSNLGVVRFEQQRYVDAEKALQKAIKLNPNDGFAHSVLGIVYYQLGRFDDSIETLSRAIQLDDADARSRNYLGIACSQKGWQEAAEKSLRKAIEIDPAYGDAHFNLAVIYATQRPPAKELSKKHYKMALDLGIPKDAQLEKLVE